ncbi:uncharacterized protein BDR25DRAFT_361810 [Lindgomyces ingoldianus]|uniref:Uncharacterized protein n=1 Tax=Lindgomyces ingoldianus TaxID=673940 RepID=A0ACB6QBN3_9PLEO|nr:uncharacterized protein BDR25DRAFT_361810 [Lindgomyces ingoldianus]KAF2464306.1 hypothetical protein BDR25DRAFT_361810 [Lindgomyces ingoldianus]
MAEHQMNWKPIDNILNFQKYSEAEFAISFTTSFAASDLGFMLFTYRSMHKHCRQLMMQLRYIRMYVDSDYRQKSVSSGALLNSRKRVTIRICSISFHIDIDVTKLAITVASIPLMISILKICELDIGLLISQNPHSFNPLVASPTGQPSS